VAWETGDVKDVGVAGGFVFAWREHLICACVIASDNIESTPLARAVLARGTEEMHLISRNWIFHIRT